MDSKVEVAAVKFILGRHLTAVAPSGSGLSICDVQLKQVDLWGRGMKEVWGIPKENGHGKACRPRFSGLKHTELL